MLKGETKARNPAPKEVFIQSKVLCRSQANEERGRSCMEGVLQLWRDANTFAAVLVFYTLVQAARKTNRVLSQLSHLTWSNVTRSETKPQHPLPPLCLDQLSCHCLHRKCLLSRKHISSQCEMNSLEKWGFLLCLPSKESERQQEERQEGGR